MSISKSATSGPNMGFPKLLPGQNDRLDLKIKLERSKNHEMTQPAQNGQTNFQDMAAKRPYLF
eukprot:5295723-Karenia_brevis.AAC.1